MLTLSKSSIPLGDNAAARRIANYLLDRNEAPDAYTRTPDTGEGDAPREELANAVWVGSDNALAKQGVTRGAEVKVEELVRALQGQHVTTGEQVRKPGNVTRLVGPPDDEGQLTKISEKVVTNIQMGLHPPKSWSTAVARADREHRRELIQGLMRAANVAAEHVTQTKRVVHRRFPNLKLRMREEAKGMVAAAVVHMTARKAAGENVPAPQVHVHLQIVGVENALGELVTPDSFEMFKYDAALEGGAVFRAVLADEMVKLGYRIRSETGKKGRFFEVEGIPDELVEYMSGRTREVEAEIAAMEAQLGYKLTGGALAAVAVKTRSAKSREHTGYETQKIWDASCEEFGYGEAEGLAIRSHYKGYEAPLDVRRKEWVERYLRKLDERGPTVTKGTAVASGHEVAPGLLSYEEAHWMMSALEETGELIPLKGRRATSLQIRLSEAEILKVAEAAARERRDPISAAAKAKGIAIANEALGDGKSMDEEQLAAFENLTNGSGWTALTGLAGTGKGPTLHAAAAAHVADGWKVIACAADGTTAARLGEQIGATACTLDKLKNDLDWGNVSLTDRTLILIDEATKVRRGLWNEIKDYVQAYGVRVIPIGDPGQMDAIDAPGMFEAQLRSDVIPVSELTEVRRHRDPDDPSKIHPWLRDYQVAISEGRAEEAIALLIRAKRLRIFETRREAMEAMVDDWDEWRRPYDPLKTALLVHGPNTDIDEVNRLAQAKRIAAGQVTGPGVKAIDRDYLIHAGDTVILAVAAYRFPRGTSREAKRRIENGTLGIVTEVDPDRDVMWVRTREPGIGERTSMIELGPLREQLAEGKKAPSFRHATGRHIYGEQGASEMMTGALAGHWSMDKLSAYVADSRSIFDHTVYASIEELSKDGTRESAVRELAKKMKKSRKRKASIAYEEEKDGRVNPLLPIMSVVPPLPVHEVEELAVTVARETTEPPMEVLVPEEGAKPERAAAEAAEVRREDINVKDPLLEWEQYLGVRRTNVVREDAGLLGPPPVHLAKLTDAALRETRDAAAKAFRTLHRGAALETLGLEQKIEKRQARMIEAELTAERLRAHAETDGRRERAQREAAAKVQDGLAAEDRKALDELKAADKRLRDRDVHLNQWYEKNAKSVKDWAGAEREMALRRGVEIEEAARSATAAPPEHVVKAIGERPASGSELRLEWDALAKDLVRDRMRVELAERDDVPALVNKGDQARLVMRIRELQDLLAEAEEARAEEAGAEQAQDADAPEQAPQGDATEQAPPESGPELDR